MILLFLDSTTLIGWRLNINSTRARELREIARDARCPIYVSELVIKESSRQQAYDINKIFREAREAGEGVNDLYPKQVLYLYQQIMQHSGDAVGLRDVGRLESAVYRPQASFGGRDLYPDLFSKAAALGHAIIRNHPFVDGNKRVGVEAMRLLLRLNGRDLHASLEARFDFVVEIAQGKLTEQRIADWLKAHSRPYKKR